ncbi:MAG: hypothetical protein EOP05_12530 [Proteobacteria bacterium]|nr:MAG: hypothetical protein EOP05_12530 [Pseudomonadota bacterium]
MFPWEQWIPNGAEAEFQASSHGSRVSIKKRIEETCVEGFKKRTKNRVAKPTRALDVMVRIDEDYCTISIDTSGEILHKRGTRALSSDAPIRETIASALLFWMITKNEDANAGARFVKQTPKAITLVDPMMGAGTFFLEAAHLGENVSGRDFAFEQFPRFQRERDAKVAAEVEATLIASGSDEATPEALLSHQSRLRNPFAKFIGLDSDPKAVRTTEGNLKPLIGQHEIEAIQGDIFKVEPLAAKSSDNARWILANPPYGERLRIEGPLKDYYESLFAACERFAEPERACFILPETAKPTSLKAPREWKFDDSLKFQNGGIPVVALMFVRK